MDDFIFCAVGASGVLYLPSILLMKSEFHFRCFAHSQNSYTSFHKISVNIIPNVYIATPTKTEICLS